MELSGKEFCVEFFFIIFVINVTALSGTQLSWTDWTIVCNKLKSLEPRGPIAGNMEARPSNTRPADNVPVVRSHSDICLESYCHYYCYFIITPAVLQNCI
jgi:hypothetical protein